MYDKRGCMALLDRMGESFRKELRLLARTYNRQGKVGSSYKRLISCMADFVYHPVLSLTLTDPLGICLRLVNENIKKQEKLTKKDFLEGLKGNVNLRYEPIEVTETQKKRCPQNA